MKEKETTTIVCEHCGLQRKVEVKVRFLYYEEWKSGEPYSRFLPDIGQLVIVNPYGLTKDEWKAAEVTKSRDQFIRELHERISALEAALAEKGGLR